MCAGLFLSLSLCIHSPLPLPQVAAKIKELLPSTFASTGGPNTMVATEYTPQVQGATKMATQIENSGQCTAMRHLVKEGRKFLKRSLLQLA